MESEMWGKRGESSNGNYQAATLCCALLPIPTCLSPVVLTAMLWTKVYHRWPCFEINRHGAQLPPGTPTSHTSASALLPSSFLHNPGKPRVMAQVPESSTPTWENWMEFSQDRPSEVSRQKENISIRQSCLQVDENKCLES